MSADLSRLTAAARPPIERQTLALRLWDGDAHTPAVYVATPHADHRPGYTLRRYRPEQPTPAETLLDGLRTIAQAIA